MCPGIHLAERNQWRIIAKLLWAFEIQEPEGVDLDPEAYNEGLLHAPAPFKAVFKSRGPEYIETVRRTLGDCKKELAKYD